MADHLLSQLKGGREGGERNQVRGTGSSLSMCTEGRSNVPLAWGPEHAYLLVFLQPSLQPLRVGLSLPQGTQLPLALVQPGAQAAVLLEELGQLVPQDL